MEQFTNLLNRLNRNQNIGYSFIRIFLGVALLVRGWALASNPDAIFELAGVENLHMYYSYITIGHLLGGICLAIGVLTRISALIQIPILVGAVSLSEMGLMMGGQSLELATMVLFLLIVFFVFGAGPLAVSRYANKKAPEAGAEPMDSTIPA